LLQQQELVAAQEAASKFIRKQCDIHKQGLMNVLVIVENFRCWAKTGNWEKMSFIIKTISLI